MEKIKKRIANLKVAGKLKVYRMTVLVMTLFLVLVALISTLVIRSNIEKITEVWSPSLEYLQDLETMTAKYRIKQYQHLVESDAAVMNSCEEEITKLESQIEDTGAKLDAIISAGIALFLMCAEEKNLVLLKISSMMQKLLLTMALKKLPF